jgi:hypothetical protein
MPRPTSGRLPNIQVPQKVLSRKDVCASSLAIHSLVVFLLHDHNVRRVRAPPFLVISRSFILCSSGQLTLRGRAPSRWRSRSSRKARPTHGRQDPDSEGLHWPKIPFVMEQRLRVPIRSRPVIWWAIPSVVRPSRAEVSLAVTRYCLHDNHCESDVSNRWQSYSDHGQLIFTYQ